MKRVFLDLETGYDENLIDVFTDGISAPSNWKDEAKILAKIEEKKKEAKSKMMVDTDFSTIKCIGFKLEGEEAIILGLHSFSAVLEEYRKQGEGIQLVTFNGKKFDIPIIIKQGLKQKLDLPYESLKIALEKYPKGVPSIEHIDLMEKIGQQGDYKSMDKYLQVYLGIKKKEIDFMNCTLEELQAHCKEDVENLEKLYNFFLPIL